MIRCLTEIDLQLGIRIGSYGLPWSSYLTELSKPVTSGSQEVDWTRLSYAGISTRSGASLVNVAGCGPEPGAKSGRTVVGNIRIT